jgi:uncharacterized membrane protein HdeD (DUF308 family)
MSSATQLPMGMDAATARTLRGRWGWFVALGVGLIVLGTIALGAAALVTLASVLFFGCLLLVGGVIEAGHAFWVRHWSGLVWHLFAGLLKVVVGVLLIANPGVGALSLTLLLAAFLMVGGLFRISAAIAHQFPGRGWVLLGGIVTLCLGVFIWAQWPVSGLWVIGTFVAVDLLFDGWSLVMIGSAVHNLPA